MELRSFRLVTAASALAGAGFLVWVGTGIGGPETTTLISNIVQAGSALHGVAQRLW